MYTPRQSVMGKLFPSPNDIRDMEIKDTLNAAKQTGIFSNKSKQIMVIRLRCTGAHNGP